MSESNFDTGLIRPPCNILFIMADQFRADGLACVGGYGRTDALDQLAGEGMLFRRAVTNSPQCIPARFALATGLYPHQTGVWRNGGQTLPPEAPNWIRVLADAGYRTSLFGKTHFHESAHASHDLRDGLDLMRGYGLMDVDEIGGPWASRQVISNMTERWHAAGVFDAFRDDVMARIHDKPYAASPSPLGAAEYYDTYVGEMAARYLAGYDRAEPWFCWVSFAGPHAPWDAPAPYDTLHDPAAAPLAIPPYGHADDVGGLLKAMVQAASAAPISAEDIAAMRANYAGNITLIDDQIANIIATIQARGEYDNTMIIFTSDHGEMNGDHGLIYKSNFLAAAVNIPLIIRPPGAALARHESEALVELFDVGATILDYAGCDAAPGSHALSVRALIEGKTARHREFVLSEFRHHSMVADARWKAEFGPGGRVKLLFDNAADEQEQNNLAQSPAAVPVVERLRQAWEDMLGNSETEWKISDKHHQDGTPIQMQDDALS